MAQVTEARKLEETEMLKALKHYKEHPDGPADWLTDVLGVSKFSEDQYKLLSSIPRAIRERKPIVVPSGNTQGKDFICSGIALYFLYTYGPSRVITTAPTDRQVQDVMWAEISQRWAGKKTHLPGRMLACKLDVEPGWYMLGFTTKETGGMSGKASGFHAPNVCVIISEAQAVADPIREQLDTLTSSGTGLTILIGNPLRTSGFFARAIKDTTNNIVINFDALRSPNWKYQQNLIPGMASFEWIEKKRKEWNADGQDTHPLWRARVRGLLPETTIDSLFTPELIDKITREFPRVNERRIVVSCDPARYGDDACVILGGISGRVPKTKVMPLSSGPEVCSEFLRMVRVMGANRGGLDCDGLGGPIFDFINELKPKGFELVEIHSNGRPTDEESQYANLKAEMWFYAKEQAELGKVQLPDNQYLREELQEMCYFINNSGKIQIESKDDLKERLGRSPDHADAWVMNIWLQKDAEIVREVDRWDDPENDDSDEVGGGADSAMSG